MYVWSRRYGHGTRREHAITFRSSLERLHEVRDADIFIERYDRRVYT